jgi:hypothetical protein
MSTSPPPPLQPSMEQAACLPVCAFSHTYHLFRLSAPRPAPATTSTDFTEQAEAYLIPVCNHKFCKNITSLTFIGSDWRK